MKRKLFGFMLLIPALLALAACDTSLTVGRKTIGIRSGEFLYMDGFLRANYTFPFETVWSACDRTLTELKAGDVRREKKIATGNMTALIQDDKVRIMVEYLERDMTAVSVMAGPSGSTLAAQLIHDRIGNVLQRR